IPSRRPKKCPIRAGPGVKGGAPRGNRTLLSSLGSSHSTDELPAQGNGREEARIQRKRQGGRGKTKNGGPRTEDRRQRSENRGHRNQKRGQRTEDRELRQRD